MNTVTNTQNIQNIINGLVVKAHGDPKNERTYYAMIACIKNGTLPNAPAEKVQFWRNRYAELKAKLESKPVATEQPKPEHVRGLDPKTGIQHDTPSQVLRLLDRANHEVAKHPKMAAYLLRKASQFYLQFQGENADKEVVSQKIKEANDYINSVPLNNITSALAKFDAKMRPIMMAATKTYAGNSFIKEPATA